LFIPPSFETTAINIIPHEEQVIAGEAIAQRRKR
jgi:hypothetical protein